MPCLDVSLCVSLSAVGLHVDLAPLDSCTFVSLVTELSRTLDDSSNAPALAQGASQNRAPFDSLSLFLFIFLSLSLHSSWKVGWPDLEFVMLLVAYAACMT